MWVSVTLVHSIDSLSQFLPTDEKINGESRSGKYAPTADVRDKRY